MTEANPPKPEETGSEAHARFLLLLKAIAAAPKAAICELDPKIKPKSKSPS
jgi:hypothetical protein